MSNPGKVPASSLHSSSKVCYNGIVATKSSPEGGPSMQSRLPIIFIFLLVFAVSVLAAARESVVIREWDVPAPALFRTTLR